MSVLIQSPSTPPFSKIGEAAELAAFTSAGVCVGAVVLDGSGSCGLAVWGDDPTTELIDGARNREQLTFKYWNGAKETIPAITILKGETAYTTDGILVIEMSGEPGIPLEFSLTAIFPNPFNPSVTITFNIDYSCRVVLQVFDITGREVATLYNDMAIAGNHQLVWDGSTVPSGIYLLQLKSGTKVSTAKVVLVR